MKMAELSTKRIHEAALQAMKETLDLGDLTLGASSDAYRSFKKSVMQTTLDMLREIYAAMMSTGMFESCPCGVSVLDTGPKWTRCEACSGFGLRIKDQRSEPGLWVTAPSQSATTSDTNTTPCNLVDVTGT